MLKMRTVERNVRGVKRKMVVQITAEEKGEKLRKEAEGCVINIVNEILNTALFIYLGKAAAREATKAKKEESFPKIFKKSLTCVCPCI